MAKSTSRVNELLDVVWDPGLKRPKKEVEEMQNLIQKEGGILNLQHGIGGTIQKN
ncbi:MAG: hypothetical protein Ct9H90mP4_07930 [Gammaproteobacteria bacterium]|nr:MAG: hypothetical protein Ct9H90mP4_07930 [Gammaproteobacteria bacterium]